jgi:hypothetical protein
MTAGPPTPAATRGSPWGADSSAPFLGLIIVAAPLVVEAQPEAQVWRVGLFHVGLDHVPPSLQSLREGLKALGYVDGKNLRLD